MNPRITCCRRNLRPRHRRLRSKVQAAASAAVGSWRLLLANATFTERFRISSHPPDRPKLAVARRGPRTRFNLLEPFFRSEMEKSSPLSTNVERGTGGEAERGEGAGGEAGRGG